jgi:hypothetical protein
MTIERIVSDEGAVNVQNDRQWKIEAEREYVTIRLRHGEGFILMRADDVAQFIADLQRAEAASRTL